MFGFIHTNTKAVKMCSKENQNPPETVPTRKKIRDFILTHHITLNTVLFCLGIVMIVAGSMCYYNTNKIQHAIVLAVGMVVTFVALGIYANKGLQWYKKWRQRTSESTLETFTDQDEEIAAGNELVQNPDLEMNDQHLPSGVLRLKEGS